MTIAIIGLGTFGRNVLEALMNTDADLIIVDKDREVVEKYKNSIQNAYITDAINEETLKKVIPNDIDAAIVDLGSQLETSILVTHNLSKKGVSKIIVKARSDDHGEILKLVGASKIIYPDLDAALHITPMLISSALFNYMQVSDKFAIAEVSVRNDLIGKPISKSNIRQTYQLNIIGVRNTSETEMEFVNSPEMILDKDMILLVAGTSESIMKYSEKNEETARKNTNFFARLLRH
ncbi:MAG: TrkA family potassium uptake protein [Treponema sp.]|jgi:trk system potassium uptake protein|nr:TrkA family potassium uptake protein [Treponema sp.]